MSSWNRDHPLLAPCDTVQWEQSVRGYSEADLRSIVAEELVSLKLENLTDHKFIFDA